MMAESLGKTQKEKHWEPGCTYKLPILKIVNKGNLALKYKIAISGIKGDAKLNDAIEWKAYASHNLKWIDSDLNNSGVWVDFATDKNGFLGADLSTLLGNADLDNLTEEEKAQISAIYGEDNVDFENGVLIDDTNSVMNGSDPYPDEYYLQLCGHMKKTAGNEYQNLSIDGIAITILATQYTYEYDSTTDQYDKDSAYPTYVVNGLPTSGDDAEHYKSDLSDVIAGTTNGYCVDGGNYVTVGTLLTFGETYGSVLINDAKIKCDTLVVLDKDNTIILQDCDITIAKGGKLVINNNNTSNQMLFRNVTINGVAVTSDNVSSIISTYCTGNFIGMVY